VDERVEIGRVDTSEGRRHRRPAISARQTSPPGLAPLRAERKVVVVTANEPKVVDNPAASRFEVLVDGEVAGFAEYQRTKAAVAFTHTVVDPAFEGRGLGSVLARGALDATRQSESPVLPFCPFIRGYIQRHPAYLDLVPAERRAEFELTPASDRPDRA
jgi:predicted GNAT family acetyltransferase